MYMDLSIYLGSSRRRVLVADPRKLFFPEAPGTQLRELVSFWEISDSLLRVSPTFWAY